MSDALCDLDLTAVARLIRSRKITSVEATEACLTRIHEWQPKINAFIAVDHDGALKQARVCDRALSRGANVGPLHGVPLAHKDMFYLPGQISSAGSFIRRRWKASRHATVLRKLTAAGAVTLGRLSMSEFAADPLGQNEYFGTCWNPWRPGHATGGSSSGSGAAVAARLVFGALGSDTGGSIRIPAALNGICGLMPTYGRISRYGAMGRSWSLDHIGPLARTAADCATLFNVIAGYDPQDGNSANIPFAPLGKLNGAIKGLRIGVPRLPKGTPLAPAVRKGLQESRAIFRDLGASLVSVRLPDLTALFQLCELIVRSEAASMHGSWMRARSKDYSDYMRGRIEGGFFVPATWYIDALRHRAQALDAFLSDVFSRCDVLHLPTTPISAPRIADQADVSAANQAALSGMADFTRPFNFLGLPCLSVPCGFDVDGLPVAFQLVGRPFAESTVLRVGAHYQRATDWTAQGPSLAAWEEAGAPASSLRATRR
jgi:aspartyl-tRNA(Asn)/glutamyl-tRNA(Gln) amidotransferase subunit A